MNALSACIMYATGGVFTYISLKNLFKKWDAIDKRSAKRKIIQIKDQKVLAKIFCEINNL